MGNPFLDQSEELNHFDQSGELLALDTGNVLNDSVVETVRTIEELGKEQFKIFYSLFLLTILGLFMSQSKRIVFHSSNAQSPNKNEAIKGC